MPPMKMRQNQAKALCSQKKWNFKTDFMKVLKIPFFTALLVVLGLSACKDEEAELARKLAGEAKSLSCEMERLKLQSDSIWDEMGAYLDTALPADMPPAERKNMASTRAAHLIAMFKAFPKLDTAIQKKVTEAGKADSSIAEQMKAVKEKLQENERITNETLLKIENQSKQHCQTLKQELQAIEEAPCHS